MNRNQTEIDEKTRILMRQQQQQNRYNSQLSTAEIGQLRRIRELERMKQQQHQHQHQHQRDHQPASMRGEPIKYQPSVIPVAQDTRSHAMMSKNELIAMTQRVQTKFYKGSDTDNTTTSSDDSNSDSSDSSDGDGVIDRVKKMYSFLGRKKSPSSSSNNSDLEIDEGFESGEEGDNSGIIGDDMSDDIGDDMDEEIVPDTSQNTEIAQIETGLPIGNADVDEASQKAAKDRLRRRRQTLQTVQLPSAASEPDILRDTPGASRFNGLIAETGEPSAANERDFIRSGTTLGGQAIVSRPLRLIQRYVEKLVMVDSAKRDARVWPNASEYGFDFAIPYKNVIQFQITQFNLLNTIPNFTSELQNISIPIQEYDRPVVIKNIEAGYYGSPQELLTAIEAKLNEIPIFGYIPGGYPEYAAKLGVYYRPGSDYQRVDPITNNIINLFQFQDNINSTYVFDTSSALISYYYPIIYDMIKQNIEIPELTVAERNRLEFFFEGLYDYVALDIMLKYRQTLDEYRLQNTLDNALLNKYRLEFNPRTLRATIRAISLSDYILNLNRNYTNTISPGNIATDLSYVKLVDLEPNLQVDTAIAQDMFYEFGRQWVRIFGSTIESLPMPYFTDICGAPRVELGVHHHLLHSDSMTRISDTYNSQSQLLYESNPDISSTPSLFFNPQYFPANGIFDDVLTMNIKFYHKLLFPLIPGDPQNFANSYNGKKLTYDVDLSDNFYNFLLDDFAREHNIDHTPYAKLVDLDGFIPINKFRTPYYRADIFTIQSSKVAQPNEFNLTNAQLAEIFDFIPSTLSGENYTTALITRAIRIEPYVSTVILINNETYNGMGLPPRQPGLKYYLDVVYQHKFDPNYPLPDLSTNNIYKLYTQSATFPNNQINMMLYDSEQKLIYDNSYRQFGEHDMKYSSSWSTSKVVDGSYIETAIYNVPIDSMKNYYIAFALMDISRQLQSFSPINLANPSIHRWQGKVRLQFKPVIEPKIDNVYPIYSNITNLVYQPLNTVDIISHTSRINICGYRDVDYYYNKMINGYINFDQSGNRRFGYLNPINNGIDTTIQIANLSGSMAIYRPFYEQYRDDSELLALLQQTVNSRLFPTTGSPRNFINGLLTPFLPQIFARRMNYLDPIPFRILFNTYSNPLVLEPNVVWGIGFNLGFPREDTIYALAHYSNEPVNTEQEYIYLAIAEANNIDFIDKSVREFGDQVLQFQFGQSNSLYTKIMLNNYGSYGSQLVANRTIFKPVLGKLKGIHVRLVDRNNRPINNESCDHHFTIKLTLTNTEIQPYDTLELSKAADEGKIEFQSSFL